MNPQVLLPGLVLWCGLIAWSDWRARRIPNTLLVAGLAVAGLGLVFQGQTPFGIGPWASAMGLVLGLLALLPFHLARLMGAGDVKLFATAGALMGGWALWPIWLIASLLSAVHALVWAAWQRWVPGASQAAASGQQARLPYGLHLGLAMVAVALWPELTPRLSFGLAG